MAAVRLAGALGRHDLCASRAPGGRSACRACDRGSDGGGRAGDAFPRGQPARMASACCRSFLCCFSRRCGPPQGSRRRRSPTLPGTRCERELCYYGDVAFAPHLLSCLSLRGVRAHVLAEQSAMYSSRREAAAATEAIVEQLRMQLARLTGRPARGCALKVRRCFELSAFFSVSHRMQRGLGSLVSRQASRSP